MPFFPKPLPELFRQIGSPEEWEEEWELAYCRPVLFADRVGLELSKRLSHRRVSMAWFRCSVWEAVAVIEATENALMSQLELELDPPDSDERLQR
jgi:hypothetical protein